MEDEDPGGVYQHRNGGCYEIVTTARSSNDCKQRVVVCRSLQDGDYPSGTVWVRTMTEFMTPGRFVPDFTTNTACGESTTTGFFMSAIML